MPDPPRDGVPSRLADLFDDVLPQSEPRPVSRLARRLEERERDDSVEVATDPGEASFAGLIDDDDEPQREGLPSSYRMRHDHQFVRRLSDESGGPRLESVEIARITAVETLDDPTPPRAIDRLVLSVREFGVLQPLLVRSRTESASGEDFALIDGRARLAAARAAGLRHVPCIVLEVSETAARQIAEQSRVQERVRPGGAGENLTTCNQEIAASLSTVLSCVEAIAANPGRLLGRAGLDIVSAETRRALWFVEALDAHGCSAVTPLPIEAAPLLEREIDRLEPEARLLGVWLRRDLKHRTLTTWADESLLRVAFSGMLRTALGMLGDGPDGGLSVRFDRFGDHRLLVEVTQEPSPFTQLEGSWALESMTNRPDAQPAVALAMRVARRIAELHEGALDLLDAERGGFTLRLSLPAAEIDAVS